MSNFNPRVLGAKCDVCPRKRQTPVPSDGDPAKAKVIWLGQDPGKQEVDQLRPFVGPTGVRTFKLWDKACKENGIPPVPRSEIYIVNGASCMPITKRESEAKTAMTCCRPRALGEIHRVISTSTAESVLVLAMGKWALFTLTGKPTGMGKLQGFHMPVDLDTAILDANRNAMLFETRARALAAKSTSTEDEDDIPF